MFTSQRKGSSGFAPSPRSEVSANPRRLGKGTTAVPVEVTPPPPLASLGVNGGDSVAQATDGDEMEVWQRFRDAGLLDEASLEKRGREALAERIRKLEGELYDYQYNMGLLLIEKNEWASKIEELNHTLAETRETTKREQAAHFVAISEIEKREENLRKALEVEKQCVADLEKALHELRSESAGVKVTSDEKLAEAHALVTSVEEKSLKVESKLHTAEATLAEVSRKGSEMDRKLLEVETRENVLRRERLSFNAEKETHESLYFKQREELRKWEDKLHEGQRRLLDNQRLLNQREARTNDKEKVLIQKEKNLEDAQKNVEISSSSLKEKEADISARSAALTMQEKEMELKVKNLEIKEQELVALEEKLSAREKIELQKLISEHKAVLDTQMEEFRLEMNQKRASLDDEMRNKADALDKKVAELDVRDAGLLRREKTLEKKTEKLVEKEKECELRFKALKERERFVKAGEKSLEAEKKQLENEKQELYNLRSELAKDRLAKEELVQRLLMKQEDLRVTEDEREVHSTLQAALKSSLEECRLQKELLMKERGDLKHDREKIERDWEVLDEKKTQVESEENQLMEKKDAFSRWMEDEKMRLKSEKVALEEESRRKLEALDVDRESYAAKMKQEKFEFYERAQAEREDMLHNVKQQCYALECSIRQQQEEVEKQLSEKRRYFEEDKEKEMSYINFMREQTEREMEVIRLEKENIERSRHDCASERVRLEMNRTDIQQDIAELQSLHQKVRNQREELGKEKSRFFAFVEKSSTCKNCGEMAFSSLENLVEIEDAGAAPLLRLAEGCIREKTAKVSLPSFDLSPGGRHSSSGGSIPSWLRKCTKYIGNFTPLRRSNDTTGTLGEGSLSHAAESSRDIPEKFHEAEEPELSPVAPAVDREPTQDNDSKEMEDPAFCVDGDHEMYQSQSGSELLSVSLDNGVTGKLVREGSRRKSVKKSGKLRATYSMNRVLDESRSILAESEEAKNGEIESSRKHDYQTCEKFEGNKTSHARRKRQRRSTTTEDNADVSEAHTDSIPTRGFRRKQPVNPGMELPGATRYNLRSAGGSKPAMGQQASRSGKVGSQLNKVPTSNKAAEDAKLEAGKAGPSSHVCSPTEDTSPSRINMTEKIIMSSVVRVQEIPQQAFGVKDGAVGSENSGGINEAQEEDGSYSTDEADYGDESEDASDNHSASIGNKLWKFFTS